MPQPIVSILGGGGGPPGGGGGGGRGGGGGGGGGGSSLTSTCRYGTRAHIRALETVADVATWRPETRRVIGWIFESKPPRCTGARVYPTRALNRRGSKLSYGGEEEEEDRSRRRRRSIVHASKHKCCKPAVDTRYSSAQFRVQTAKKIAQATRKARGALLRQLEWAADATHQSPPGILKDYVAPEE